MPKSPNVSREDNASPDDVSTVDAIVRVLYECVTFAPGTQPNYQRLRSLFHPDGRLTPPKDEKETHTSILDADTFISKSREYVILAGLEKKGFSETEVHRQTEMFGNIVQVFSTYESRHLPTDPTPIQRGINSIQLVRDNHRWWVVSILWDVERVKNPIPSRYLG